MLQERRSEDAVQIFERSGPGSLQRRPPGTAVAPSTLSAMTPTLLETLRPTFSGNQAFATETSSQLIGLGVRSGTPHSPPYFGRGQPSMRGFPTTSNLPAVNNMQGTTRESNWIRRETYKVKNGRLSPYAF